MILLELNDIKVHFTDIHNAHRFLLHSAYLWQRALFFFLKNQVWTRARHIHHYADEELRIVLEGQN